MEEMIDDAMTMDDDEEVQEAASEEVDKILFEITNGVNPQEYTIFLIIYL